MVDELGSVQIRPKRQDLGIIHRERQTPLLCGEAKMPGTREPAPHTTDRVERALLPASRASARAAVCLRTCGAVEKVWNNRLGC